MTATMVLNWKGASVVAKVRVAEIAGLRRVGEECVQMAKSIVNVDTGLLQSRIRVLKADAFMYTARLEWGAPDVPYSIWQEILPPPRGKSYLRPAADACYPRLLGYIRQDLI